MSPLADGEKKLRFTGLNAMEMEDNNESKNEKRQIYGRRKPIYSIGYKNLSKLHHYHTKTTGNKVHILTFGLIHANMFAKKLKRRVARRRALNNKMNYTLERIDFEDEPDMRYV